MVGSEGAHKRLGKLIEELRDLRPHLGLPEDFLTIYYDKGINLLSELEAAMGSGELPEAILTRRLRFSKDLVESVQRAMQTDQIGYARLGLYLRICMELFPQVAVKAAKKYGLDPVAIIEAVDKLLKIDGKDRGVYFLGYIGNPNKYSSITTLVPDNTLKTLAVSAFNETLSHHSVNDAFEHAYLKLERTHKHLRDIGWMSGDIPFQFTFFIHRLPKAHVDQVTNDEKMGFSLFSNAICELFMAMCKSNRR